MSDGIRAKRLGGTVRKHLGEALARQVRDPRLASLVIEDVQLTGDLGLATVLVRLVVGGDDPAARQGAMKALVGLAPVLRSSLAPVLRMRRVPDLRFRYDEGTDHRLRIEEVLSEIHREDEARRQAAEPLRGVENDATIAPESARTHGDTATSEDAARTHGDAATGEPPPREDDPSTR